MTTTHNKKRVGLGIQTLSKCVCVCVWAAGAGKGYHYTVRKKQAATLWRQSHSVVAVFFYPSGSKSMGWSGVSGPTRPHFPPTLESTGQSRSHTKFFALFCCGPCSRVKCFLGSVKVYKGVALGGNGWQLDESGAGQKCWSRRKQSCLLLLFWELLLD